MYASVRCHPQVVIDYNQSDYSIIGEEYLEDKRSLVH